ncbi:helix-turn-helix transcriptional regulator [Cognatishimia activa]|uniref:Putative transcriptional regulator n=1 Tax=Cognatishimia activa TaxID=1715691 RepID=A0A0P1IKV3_9RHOB|nr:hypothetical protein [Cognatishimia activa]CUI27527.1 putative transcriptional regulator [Cognatishimia activa]CUK24243.1 putative transcriptional regulator [Cognatishimia activa]
MNTFDQTVGAGAPLSQIDYATLPDQALLNAKQVRALCSMSPAVLDRRIAQDRFPSPCFHGRNRVWPWAKIRFWLELAAQQETPLEN